VQFAVVAPRRCSCARGGVRCVVKPAAPTAHRTRYARLPRLHGSHTFNATVHAPAPPGVVRGQQRRRCAPPRRRVCRLVADRVTLRTVASWLGPVPNLSCGPFSLGTRQSIHIAPNRSPDPGDGVRPPRWSGRLVPTVSGESFAAPATVHLLEPHPRRISPSCARSARYARVAACGRAARRAGSMHRVRYVYMEAMRLPPSSLSTSSLAACISAAIVMTRAAVSG